MFEAWVFSALLVVLALAAYRIQQKKLASSYTATELSFVANTSAALLLLPATLYLTWLNRGAFTGEIGAALGVSVIANVAGFVLLFRSFAIEDLSVVVPLTGLAPVFVALLEPWVGPEVYAPELILGSILSTLGVYIVLIEDEGLLTPVARARDRGPQLAVASQGFIAFAILADDYAVGSIDPVAYGGVLSASLSVVFGGILLFQVRNKPSFSLRSLTNRKLATLGGTRGVHVVMVMITFSLTSATRATIFFQLAPVLAVIIGSRLFDEEYFLRRLIGAGLLAVAVYVVL